MNRASAVQHLSVPIKILNTFFRKSQFHRGGRLLCDWGFSLVLQVGKTDLLWLHLTSKSSNQLGLSWVFALKREK
jgi:hypothetical protein